MPCDSTSLPSSSSSSSYPPSPFLLDLPLALLEVTLARLPLPSVLAVSSCSKDLHSIVSSLFFSRLHSLSPPNCSPWFFLFGFNHLLPHKNQAFAFNPTSHTWLQLPLSPPPSHNASSLSGMNGSLFALAGALQARLCIASSPLKQNWQVIEASMEVGRRDPLVGIFFEDTCSLTIGSIVVAGGVEEDAAHNNDLAVEVYDAQKKQWKRCNSLPELFRGKSLSSATVGGRFYVGDRHGEAVCWLEKGKGRWKEGTAERPSGLVRWELVGSEGVGLLAVAVCAGGGVKVYKLVGEEEGGSNMREVAEMPAELFELFEEEDEKQVVVRSCAGGSNLLYVYSDSPFKEYAACMCDLGGGGSRWYKVPPLPSPPLHRFDKVACLSSSVPLSSCLP